MGIDPGKDGFITFNIGDELIFKWIGDFVVGKEYSTTRFTAFFKQFEGINMHVVLEDVNCTPKWGARTNWVLSRCKALIEQALSDHKIPHTLVKPQAWQKEMYQGVPEMRKTPKDGKKKGERDTKAMSIIAVERLFPNIDTRRTTRCKDPHDGKTDSILMYEYGKRKF